MAATSLRLFASLVRIFGTGVVPLTRAEIAAGSLSCDDSPAWTAVKAIVQRVAAAFDSSIANRSAADIEVLNGFDQLRFVANQHGLGFVLGADCPLGTRALRLICASLVSGRVDALCKHALGTDKRVHCKSWAATADFLSSSSPSFRSIIESGWPLFALAYGYVTSFLSRRQHMMNADRACAGRSYSAHANTLPGLVAAHLLARPERFRITYEQVVEYANFGATRRLDFGTCHQADGFADLAAALALQSAKEHAVHVPKTESSKVANDDIFRFIDSGEEHFRRWWIPYEEAHAQGTSIRVEICHDHPSLKCNAVRYESRGLESPLFQLRALLAWPIFEVLQRLQALITKQPRTMATPIGYGFDKLPLRASDFEGMTATHWEERRRLLSKGVFGSSQRPVIDPVEGTLGTGQTTLTWSLGRVNATALVSRIQGLTRSRGLVVMHAGHESNSYSFTGCTDPFGYAGLFRSMGFDSIVLTMPLLGFNRQNESGGIYDSHVVHEIFRQWSDEGEEGVLSYFVAPVLLAIDWAAMNLGHSQVAMVGCSGGSWTTILAAALDQRITLSIASPTHPPPHLFDAIDWFALDWETRMNPPHLYETCSFLCMYVLATLGPAMRHSVHIFHLSENHPMPAPMGVWGIEDQLNAYYQEFLPAVLQAAHGGLETLPLQMAIVDPSRHCGDWRVFGIMHGLLERWSSPSKKVFAEWPMPLGVRFNRHSGD